MSTIHRFARLKVRLFINENDHPPPHVHVETTLTVFRLRIEDGAIIDGTSRPYEKAAQKELKLVREWMRDNRIALRRAWAQHENGKKVDPIP